MVLNQSEDSPIIQVDLQELVYVLFECGNNNAQKDGRRVLQPKRHNGVLKAAPFRCEGHLASVLWHDFDLVVP